MVVNKDNVLRMLDALQQGLDEANAGRKLDAIKIGYNEGYLTALKNIRFIVSVVWEEKK